MADSKISALTNYTTPQSADVLPIVNVSGSQTEKVTMANIAANLPAITTSAINVTGLTISSAVATDASKNLVSVTNTGTGNNVLASSPTLVTPTLGAATATSINGNTFTTGTYTLTGTAAKTLTFSDSTTLATNTITLGGGEVVTFSATNALSLLTTGTTVMTFPAATDTVVTLAASQTLTNKTLTAPILTTPALGTPASGIVTNLTGTASININGTVGATTPAAGTFTLVRDANNAITASSNAATVPVTSRLSTVTNNSAATLTITITTSGAVDGQMLVVRVLDSSAAAQTITWVNTENSTVTAPTTSNGSTTLFLTIGFIYNGGTSKWRTIAAA